MRILFQNDFVNFINGSGNATCTLAKALSAENEIKVLSAGESIFKTKKIIDENIEIIKAPAFDIMGFNFILPFKRIFEKIIDDFRPDLVQLELQSPGAGVFAKVCKNKGIPITARMHGVVRNIWEIISPHIFRRGFFDYLSRQILNKASLVSFPSRFTLKEYSNIIHDNLKTEIISNGIDLDVYNKKNVNEDFKDELIHNKDNLKILFIGRFTRGKRPDFILEAIKDREDCDVHLVGTGPLEKNIDKFVSKNNLDKYVFKYKNLSLGDLLALYDFCDSLILPSVMESQGLVLLEAAAFKKPLIGSDFGAIPENITDGVNGYLFNHLDYKDLNNKIERMKDEKVRKKMGEKAYKLVKDNHDLNIVVDKWKKVYSEFVKR